MADLSKHSVSSYDEEYPSDLSTQEEEKSIPFLRRLRDMLLENKDVISFDPGHQTSNARVLGRIVVHDRVLVEAKVLPRYFNHSSFASLRRQLNYFSFVRLGKGRQRESTYINEHVVVLDDILHLKRRPSTGNVGSMFKTRNGDPPVLQLSGPSESPIDKLERHPKRRRQTKECMPTTVSPRSTSPVCNNLESDVDDDSFRDACVVLDLTKPEYKPDADILDGCRNLLFLSAKRWN